MQKSVWYYMLYPAPAMAAILGLACIAIGWPFSIALIVFFWFGLGRYERLRERNEDERVRNVKSMARAFPQAD